MRTDPYRILYVLNSVGGGASGGIYDLTSQLPRSKFLPFAAVPSGSSAKINSIRNSFSDVREVQLPWWNVAYDAGLLRRSAFQFGKWQRGITSRSSCTRISQLIDEWRIDLVHTGTSLTLGGALAAEAMKKPHLWHIKECVGENNRVRFGMSDKELVGYISRLSDRVVAMSEYVADVFRQHHCSAITVLPDHKAPSPNAVKDLSTRKQVVFRSRVRQNAGRFDNTHPHSGECGYQSP